MILLTGYYQFGIEAAQLRDATLDKTLYRAIGATDEASGWGAKVNIKERRFVLEKAVGVFSDKHGYWYVLEFVLKNNNISFLVVKENSSEQYRFKLKRRKGSEQFWGTSRSLHLNPPSTTTVNCLATETPEITSNLTGVPERMLVPPQRSGLH